MEWLHTGIIAPILLLILFPLIFIWFIVFGGIFVKFKENLRKNHELMACSTDSDCPEGHICVGGKCVLAQ